MWKREQLIKKVDTKYDCEKCSQRITHRIKIIYPLEQKYIGERNQWIYNHANYDDVLHCISPNYLPDDIKEENKVNDACKVVVWCCSIPSGDHLPGE